MLGLDAAGKTTILYKLHIGEILSTVPTVGMFQVFRSGTQVAKSDQSMCAFSNRVLLMQL
jgi:hypothetical protein